MRKSKAFKFLCTLSVLLFVAVFSKTGMAQVEGNDVVIGQSLTLTSKILKGEVPVLISVPEGYNAGFRVLTLEDSIILRQIEQK